MSQERKDGLLRNDFIIDGKRYYVYGHTEKELQEKEFNKRKKIESAIETRYNPTVQEYFEKRIEQHKDSISNSTYLSLVGTKNSLCRIYIDSYSRTFGEIQLKKVTNDDLYYIQEKLKKTCKSSTVNSYMFRLKHLFYDAISERLIIVNPFDLIKSLKRTEEKARNTYHRALSIEEQNAFFNCELTKKSPYYNIFCMAISTGLRIGELGALKYKDLKSDHFIVQRTITRTNTEAWGIGEDTKTESGKRTIPLTDNIKTIIDKQRKQRLKNSNIIDMDEIIFTAPQGGLIYGQYVNNEIKKICKHIGINVFTSHAFRDTFATRTIESGMNPKTLQEILGHKDYAITMNLYCHVLDNTKKDQMNKINIALF